ncbi:D-glycero-beta-D-manno-heptose 1,7-bisphosphate 7-phosphatase [Candidatus Kaiserbacteria bacterium]|nr:D-glycero-beta-D-manno-heptose 1,7-bisphosphate 7-phosphatase [Candidatus Kaiserbacteria bacterium]
MNTIDVVFLDRDGVINEEVEYLHDPKDLVLIPGVVRAVRLLNERHIPVVVITNQAGVARGYYPESQIHVLHTALSKELEKEGAHIDRYYHCPHHPEHGKNEYLVDCDCRKPKPGLLHRAAKDMHLDLRRCALVGDKVSDIAAGVSVGCTTILVKTGYGDKEWKTWKEDFKPSYVAADILDATEWILRPVAYPVR